MSLTKSDKLLNALRKGQFLSSKQVANRFGLVNVSSTISRLRDQGYRILTVTDKKTGRTGYSY